MNALISGTLGRPSLTELQTMIGAVQKLRNGQRGEGVDDFVTYRYVYVEGEGVIYEIVK